MAIKDFNMLESGNEKAELNTRLISDSVERATDGDILPPIIDNSTELDQQLFHESVMSYSLGYIAIPRSLFQNPLWQDLSLEEQHLFITIYLHSAFNNFKMYDHGKLIEILPGQLLITIRQLAEKCSNKKKKFSPATIHRKIFKLESVGFLRQETRHIKTLITITEPSICDYLKCKNETRNETRMRQDRDKNETEKNNIISKYNNNLSCPKSESSQRLIISDTSSPKKAAAAAYVPSADALGLSEFLFENIKKLNPKQKSPDLKKWAKHVDDLINLDNRTADEIKAVIEWVSGDSFWQPNVLSTDKLRKKFDTLMAKMSAQKISVIKPNGKAQLLNKFKNNETYGTYHFFRDEKGICFQPQNGQTRYTLNFNTSGFHEQFANLLFKLKIDAPNDL